MTIKAQLLVEHSKTNAVLIADFIGTNSVSVGVLVNCFLSKEYKVSQRASMVIAIIGDREPKLLSVHIKAFVDALTNPNEKDAVIRIIVRFFQFHDLPDQFKGIVLERCYQILKDSTQATAIRAFALGTIYNISKDYISLKEELKLVLEDLYTAGSSGLENRRKKTIRLL